MRLILLLALLTSISFAGGREEGKPSSRAVLSVVAKMAQDGVDTLKFNNESMLIIIKKVNLDSAAVENYARGLDKDLTKKNSDSTQVIVVPPIDPSQLKRGYQSEQEVIVVPPISK